MKTFREFLQETVFNDQAKRAWRNQLKQQSDPEYKPDTKPLEPGQQVQIKRGRGEHAGKVGTVVRVDKPEASSESGQHEYQVKVPGSTSGHSSDVFKHTDLKPRKPTGTF